MTRRTSLGAALLLALVASAAQAQGPTRPNILWLLAEDMGPALGVYGTPEVHTPHLDALAGRGMLFRNAFTTAPVCSPSRSAFNTGMYQTTIGAHNHRSHRPAEPGYRPHPLPEGVRIVSDWLRDAGYYTGNVVEMPEGVGFRGTGKTDWNFTYRGKPFDTNRWSDLKAHQPFYAQINFPETHRGPEWNDAHEGLSPPADPARVQLPPYYPDHPVVRQDWAQYLNAAMQLDRKIGAVLEQLAKDGLADNTIVVFMADNGAAMVRGKQWPYDSGLHVPLIVYWPAGIPAPAGYRAGTAPDQLVNSIDVTATTLFAAGLGKPPRMQGRVLFGPNAGPPRRFVFGGRDRGDETVDRVRTVRSDRYRYLRNYFPNQGLLQTNRYKEATYPAIWAIRKLHAEGKLSPVQARLMEKTRPAEELYDLTADPHETVNLAGSPAHQGVLRELRQVLDEWIISSDDQGRIPENPANARHYEAQSRRNYGTRIEKLRKEWGVEDY